MRPLRWTAVFCVHCCVVRMFGNLDTGTPIQQYSSTQESNHVSYVEFKRVVKLMAAAETCGVLVLLYAGSKVGTAAVREVLSRFLSPVSKDENSRIAVHVHAEVSVLTTTAVPLLLCTCAHRCCVL